MRFPRLSPLLLIVPLGWQGTGLAAEPPAATATPASNVSAAPASTVSVVGEKVPSDDAVLKDFHSLGLIEGHTNIFRCASPVRDLVEKASSTADSKDAATLSQQAKDRIKRFKDLGIRTIISFESPAPADAQDAAADQDKPKRVQATMALEKAAAAELGLNYISRPIANSGRHSLEDMSDEEVVKLLDSISDEIFRRAAEGGVVFHCSAGHDRTGIVAAYLRMKYQHWPAGEAIDEMRRYGHNWPKFSNNGGVSSWHEDHLRAIEKRMAEATP